MRISKKKSLSNIIAFHYFFTKINMLCGGLIVDVSSFVLYSSSCCNNNNRFYSTSLPSIKRFYSKSGWQKKDVNFYKDKIKSVDSYFRSRFTHYGIVLYLILSNLSFVGVLVWFEPDLHYTFLDWVFSYSFFISLLYGVLVFNFTTFYLDDFYYSPLRSSDENKYIWKVFFLY